MNGKHDKEGEKYNDGREKSMMRNDVNRYNFERFVL